MSEYSALISETLMDRLLADWFRSGGADKNGANSYAYQIKGRFYIELHSKTKTIAIFRVLNDGKLKLIKYSPNKRNIKRIKSHSKSITTTAISERDSFDEADMDDLDATLAELDNLYTFDKSAENIEISTAITGILPSYVEEGKPFRMTHSKEMQ